MAEHRAVPRSTTVSSVDSSKPLVSVCLLTYNHRHVIEQTIVSVLAQDYGPFEFIVSDDCSGDGTWETILQLAETHSIIRPIRTPRNLGMPGNANFAVGHCSGEYIALLHHDDLYASTLLTRWAEVLMRHPSIVFVCNDYRYTSGRVRGLKLPENPINGDWFLRKQLLRNWGSPVRGTAMIRRRSWIEVDGLKEQFGLLADVDLWMRLAAMGDVGYVPEPLITVWHNRPVEYPKEYGGAGWSWERHRLLLQIHAANQRGRRVLQRSANPFGWWHFLLRLNLEQAKWLIYALFRRRWGMLKESGIGATPWDFLVTRLLRLAAIRLAIPFDNG